jgi:hypothetical protein
MSVPFVLIVAVVATVVYNLYKIVTAEVCSNPECDLHKDQILILRVRLVLVFAAIATLGFLVML